MMTPHPGRRRCDRSSTDAEYRLLRLGAKAAASPVGRALASVTPSSKHDFELPHYP
jgi:hypothetical protein